MSSPGSDALTIEIPPRLLADRATVGLLAACALALEVVAARHPAGPAGVGVLAGLALGVWYWSRYRWAPALIGATLDGRGHWQLSFSDGRTLAAVLLPGSRVLGRSVVLRWRVGSRIRAAWLTSRDLSPARLRELTVRLLASGTRDAAWDTRGGAAAR
jgi:hypothetical protein